MKKFTLVLVLGTALLTACNQGAEEAKKAMEDSIANAEAEAAKQKAMEDSIARVEAEEAAKAALDTTMQDSTVQEAAH